MKLIDWRGDAVIPKDWLRGFIVLHPIYHEHHPTGGPVINGTQLGQKQCYRLDAMLKRRDENGTVVE